MRTVTVQSASGSVVTITIDRDTVLKNFNVLNGGAMLTADPNLRVSTWGAATGEGVAEEFVFYPSALILDFPFSNGDKIFAVPYDNAGAASKFLGQLIFEDV